MNSVIIGGLKSRTIITVIILVRTIEHVITGILTVNALHLTIERIFAEKAPVVRITCVVRILKFTRLDNSECDIELFAKVFG